MQVTLSLTGCRQSSPRPNEFTCRFSSRTVTDGARGVHAHLRRSGEPLILELRESFRLRDPTSLLEYQDLTLQGLEYESAYCDYWNSTSGGDGKV